MKGRKKMEIYIDPNSIQPIIKLFEEANENFKVISYTGSNKKKSCSFSMSDRQGKIEIFIKKTTVKLIPMNKSIDEEKILINYIGSKGFSTSVPSHTVTLKTTSETLDNLIEHINQDYEGKISYSVERNIFRFVGYNKDYLTLTFYENGTMMLQGRPYYVFNAILSFLSTVSEFSVEDIYKISSKMVRDNTPFSVVRDLMSFKLGESQSYLDEPLLKSISGALSQQNQMELSEEYVGCVAGIFKALEGYLYKLLTQKFNYKLEKHQKFSMFRQNNDGEYEIEKNIEISAKDQQILIRLYNIYKKYRHVYFHSTVDPIHTKIIESKNEAIEISDLILNEIRESYKEIKR